MHAVGMNEMKNRLAEYIRLAASGERVLVTDRDRVVDELVRKGLATPPVARERPAPPRSRLFSRYPTGKPDRPC